MDLMKNEESGKSRILIVRNKLFKFPDYIKLAFKLVIAFCSEALMPSREVSYSLIQAKRHLF